MIVDAPTQVLLACPGAETPPAVSVGFLHQMTEAVDVAVTEEIGHPLAFFRQKARRGVVFPRVVDVDVLMADVVVAREDQFRPFLAQLVHIVAEEIEPHHLEGLTFVACGARGVVHAHHGAVAEVGTQKTSLVVVEGIAHAIFHMVGFHFGDQPHPTVAFLLGREPIGVVSHHLKIHLGDLVRGGLQLLETKHIRLVFINPLEQSLPDGGTDAVDVVADDFHGVFPISNVRRYGFFKYFFVRSNVFSNLAAGKERAT